MQEQSEEYDEEEYDEEDDEDEYDETNITKKKMMKTKMMKKNMMKTKMKKQNIKRTVSPDYTLLMITKYLKMRKAQLIQLAESKGMLVDKYKKKKRRLSVSEKASIINCIIGFDENKSLIRGYYQL